MRPFSIGSLSIFALILPVFTSSHNPLEPSPSQHGTVLGPIPILDFEPSMGLQPRGPNDLSALDPQTQSHLLYGTTDLNGHLLLANMTLYAAKDLPIVLLERFVDLTEKVSCSDEEGRLVLTFASRDAFDYARRRWGYVNDADGGRFLLVVYGMGCGFDDDGKRVPYIVSDVTDEGGGLTVSLALKAVGWAEVAGEFEVEFGRMVSVPRGYRGKRSFWGEVGGAGGGVLNMTDGRFDHGGNTGDGVLNTTEGTFGKSKNARFPISAGHQNQRTTIFTDPKAGLTIDCTNCFITGSLEVMGHLSVQDFKVQDLVLTASPRSTLVALELEAIITANNGPDSLGYTMDLPRVAIPGLGISIPDIMNIGAALTYSIGGNCSFSGSATVDFGLQADVPDSAKIVADYKNHGASEATGFTGGQLTPMFGIKNESTSVTLSAYSQLGVDFGVDLFKLGTVSVAVTVKLPEISATLTAKYDEQGACSHEAGTSKTGIELDSRVNVEIDLDMDAKMGDLGPSWSETLFSDSKPLYSHCYPLDVPALLSSPNATTRPALRSNGSVSALLQGGSEFTSSSLGRGYRWALNSSSVASMPMGTVSTFDVHAMIYTSGVKALSGTESVLDATSIRALATSLTPSSTESTSILPSETWKNLEKNSISAFATSLTSSSTETTSILLSTTSRDLETNPVSTLATSSTPSISESSAILPSNTLSLSAYKRSHSTKLDITSVKPPTTGSSSILPSSTQANSADERACSTRVGTTSPKASTAESTSTLLSTTVSLSAYKSLHNTEINTAVTTPEVTSTRLIPSNSAPAPVLTSHPPLPDPGVKTTPKQPKVAPTTVEPTPKVPPLPPSPKPDVIPQPKPSKAEGNGSRKPHADPAPPPRGKSHHGPPT